MPSSPTARDAAEGLAEIEDVLAEHKAGNISGSLAASTIGLMFLKHQGPLLAALHSAGTEGGETQRAGTSSPKPPCGGPVETRPRSAAKILAGLKDVLAFTEGDTGRAELRTFAVRDGAVVEVEPGAPGGKPIADVFRGALAEAKDALAEARAAEACPYGIIDPDYARVFTIARCLAWGEGYALMIHGSFTRDLDLLAVPWTERACEPAKLVRRVEAATDLRIITPEPGAKPHGRLAWTLVFPGFGDPRFVDFGVMQPRETAVLNRVGGGEDV